MKRNKAKAKAYLRDEVDDKVRAKIYQGDKALEKMGITTTDKKEVDEKVKEFLLTLRSHVRGSLLSLDKILGYTPKCKKCFQLYGFVDKCVCHYNITETS